MKPKETKLEHPLLALEPIPRTAEGIRDCLFDEINALRSGRVTPSHARAMANLVRQFLDAVRIDVQYRAIIEKNAGKPLRLGSGESNEKL